MSECAEVGVSVWELCLCVYGMGVFVCECVVCLFVCPCVYGCECEYVGKCECLGYVWVYAVGSGVWVSRWVGVCVSVCKCART